MTLFTNGKAWTIFRHGLATHSKTGYGDQIWTAQVLPEGIPPIQRLAGFLQHEGTRPDMAACSELLRCRQTAAIVTAATGVAFTPDARLNEQIDETFDQVRERVRGFIAAVNASPHQSIWVCTHGAIIAALKNLLTVGLFTPSDALDYTKPGEILRIAGDRVEIFRFNDVV
ncbi:MAG: histidine phosphatase family protein [bacterium]|nr:histidine phosphatase family protein [bacterium]